MDADLVTTAATTLVEKLASEAWQSVVAAIGGLWRRTRPDRGEAVEAEAAEARAEVLRALGEEDDEAVADLVGEWRSRLRRLLADDPGAEDELRRLVGDWSAGGSSSDNRITMKVRASGHSRVTLAGRDVHITGS